MKSERTLNSDISFLQDRCLSAGQVNNMYFMTFGWGWPFVRISYFLLPQGIFTPNLINSETRKDQTSKSVEIAWLQRMTRWRHSGSCRALEFKAEMYLSPHGNETPTVEWPLGQPVKGGLPKNLAVGASTMGSAQAGMDCRWYLWLGYIQQLSCLRPSFSFSLLPSTNCPGPCLSVGRTRRLETAKPRTDTYQGDLGER